MSVSVCQLVTKPTGSPDAKEESQKRVQPDTSECKRKQLRWVSDFSNAAQLQTQGPPRGPAISQKILWMWDPSTTYLLNNSWFSAIPMSGKKTSSNLRSMIVTGRRREMKSIT